MNRSIINQALQISDNKNYKSPRYYFILAQIKIRDIIQFYKYISSNYVKKDLFWTCNIFICQDYKFLYYNLFLH